MKMAHLTLLDRLHVDQARQPHDIIINSVVAVVVEVGL